MSEISSLPLLSSYWRAPWKIWINSFIVWDSFNHINVKPFMILYLLVVFKILPVRNFVFFSNLFIYITDIAGNTFTSKKSLPPMEPGKNIHLFGFTGWPAGFYIISFPILLLKSLIVLRKRFTRQRLTHFWSFEHTQNVSIFGEGLYRVSKDKWLKGNSESPSRLSGRSICRLSWKVFADFGGNNYTDSRTQIICRLSEFFKK